MRLKTFLQLTALFAGSMQIETSCATGSSPGGPSELDVVSVRQYGAVGDGANDDTDAISAAIKSAPAAGAGVLNVYFPSGVYAIRRAITIPSNIRIFGDGPSSILYQKNVGANVFQSGGTSESMVFDITVEKLRFRGSGGFQTNYGLSVSSVQRLLFRDNWAESIPLINVTAPATSDESRRSANFVISGNHATGRFGEGAAILVSYAVDGIIRDNVVETYDSGIQFWGGDARNPAWPGVKRLEISSNTVRNVGAAAWGSAGQQIVIKGNHVADCTDVCLDVEGSTEVAISGNDVGNAVNGGIAAFFASSRVTISSNTVTQDSSHGSAIFIHGAGTTTGTLISANTLRVLGTAPAIDTSQGALADSTIQANEISSVAAAIHILEGDGMSILANNIRVGGATGVALEGGSRGRILDNAIISTAAQHTNSGAPIASDTSQGGIHIYWRSAAKPAQNNRIENNTIIGFPVSINDDCWGDHASLNVIRNNNLGTIYHRGGGETYHGIIENNRVNTDPNTTVPVTSY